MSTRSIGAESSFWEVAGWLFTLFKYLNEDRSIEQYDRINVQNTEQIVIVS